MRRKSQAEWAQMIESERDAWRKACGHVPHHHEHRYRGGVPSLRLRRLQIAHEARARQVGVPWDFVDLRRVWAKTNGCCGICHQPVSIDDFTVDHIVPYERGGAHILSNLQAAHRSCNSSKGNR